MQLYCNLSDMKISLIASAYLTHVLFCFLILANKLIKTIKPYTSKTNRLSCHKTTQ